MNNGGTNHNGPVQPSAGDPVTDERAHQQDIPLFDEVDYRGHRADNLWFGLGIHMPAGRGRRRRHHHHKHRPKSHKSSDTTGGGPNGIAVDLTRQDTEVLDEKSGMAPNQRVQFLLQNPEDEQEVETHRIFSEMCEMHCNGDESEWRETARWIKFEEDVEEGGNRWSKPHVATLSLHSLFELRSCLLNGQVILDMDAVELTVIVDIMLDKLVAAKHLDDIHRDEVRDTLLRRHTHQYEHMGRHASRTEGPNREASTGGFLQTVRSLADIGKNFSHGKNLSSHGSEVPPGGLKDTPDKKISLPAGPGNQLTLPTTSSVPKDMTDLPHYASEAHLKSNKSSSMFPRLAKLASSTNNQQGSNASVNTGTPPSGLNNNGYTCKKKRSANSILASIKSGGALSTMSHTSVFLDHLEAVFHLGSIHSSYHHMGNAHFMKKVPPNAESSNVLVGEVDFLQHHISAFIRLKNAVSLGDLTEVPVPTRFIFILLGPKGHASQFREIGRAIATLMSDEVFHDVAYKAHCRSDLLDGVDEFLDQVTVLPPGEWDPNIRIEPPSHVPTQEKRKIMSQESDEQKNGGDHHEEEVHAHGSDPALKRTGRLFGGFIMDVKRKYPWYLSDFKDALSLQCVASFFFMYFALLAPIVTFGGLLDEATEGYMAAIENLVSGAICGCAYHLFSGQPLTIIGSTGPVLVFETIVFDIAKTLTLNYISLRFWIGMWIAGFLMLTVATDGSTLVSYITRFTEESFACLICIIFIYEAFHKLFALLDTDVDIIPYPNMTETLCYCEGDPLNISFDNSKQMSFLKSKVRLFSLGNVYENLSSQLDFYDGSQIDFAKVPLKACEPLKGTLVDVDLSHDESGCYYMYDVFFMSLVLMVGTFCIAYSLKMFRNSLFFPTKVRTIVSDFAVMISIVIMAGVDLAFGLDTPKLNVPDVFEPTIYPRRGWFIPPFGTEDRGGQNPIWTIFLALPPAILAWILIFMDQQITAVIVNRKENKLKKGCGYHLDLFVLSILVVICSVLGLPFYVAATVMSLSHVNSLRMESESAAPGEKPVPIGVREQRVTGFLAFLLIGLSVTMTGVLKMIPMPVLYGVFLFMGISSLKGIQLVDRLLLILMPMKYQPDLVFLRHVPVKRVHLFTLCQVACLAALWVIKKIKATSILFPIMLLIMVAVRKLMEYVFTECELKYLDDPMPEITLRKKEDAKKRKKSSAEPVVEEAAGPDVPKLTTVKTENNLHIPLASGNIMKIPLKNFEADEKPINISDEVNRSGVWRHINSEQSLRNMNTDAQQQKTRDSKQSALNYVESGGGQLVPSRNGKHTIPTAVVEDDEDDDEDDEWGPVTIKVDRASPQPPSNNNRQQKEQEVPLLSKQATDPIPEESDEHHESEV